MFRRVHCTCLQLSKKKHEHHVNIDKKAKYLQYLWKDTVCLKIFFLHIVLKVVFKSSLCLYSQETNGWGKRGRETAGKPFNASAPAGGFPEDAEPTAPARPSLPPQLVSVCSTEPPAMGRGQQGDLRHLCRFRGLTHTSPFLVANDKGKDFIARV